MYQTQGRDTKYTTTVSATDGTNTAICGLGATAFEPTTSNGFPTTATICQAAASTPVAGVGGCPSGAAVSNSASEGTNVSSAMSGKRVLFKCGDSFSGAVTAGGTKFSIGAYGSCVGTQTSRPIFSGTITVSSSAVDGRVADIDFESPGTYAIFENGAPGGVSPGPMTFYNLNSNNAAAAFSYGWGHEWALIGNQMQNLGTGQEGVFVNYAENQCINNSTAYNCGGSPSFININYQALIGNSFNGASTAAGFETVRISACRMCVVNNNLIENAGGSSYAVLKFHSGNTFNSQVGWVGQYTEYVEISDNVFTGNSGAQLVEVCPQNAQNDERLRLVVVERNLFTDGAGSNKSIALSAVNATTRDNVFSAGTNIHISVAKRGVEWTGTAGAPSDTSAPELVEIYNNTCNGGANCASFSTAGWTGPGSNSIAMNNLMFNAGGGTVVGTGGSGNTISNNTTTVTANPSFTNGSGLLNRVSDFKPTANFTGATNVPVFFDAVGVTWVSGAYDLGAVHH
jgi:hypothetical protein